MKPPYSQEAETAVLGSIMIDCDIWAEVGSKLTPEHFYLIDNQMIFNACKKLANAGENPDFMLVTLELERDKADISREYIMQVNDACDPGNIQSYMAILNRLMTKRRAIAEAQDVLAMAYDEASEKQDILAATDKMARNLHELQSGGNDPRHMKDVAKSALKQFEERFANQDKLMGRTTGIKDLDEATQGLCNGQLVVVAGRPGMGKNVVLNQFIKASALADQSPCIVFSLEMRAEQLAARMYADIGSIPFQELRSGKISQQSFSGMTNAFSQLKNMNVHIDDTPGQTVFDISAKSKQLIRKYGKAGLICIDYLQLFNGTSQRQDEISKISEATRILKVLALELDCPIVLLSQLSRGVEQRPCKRPMSSDLRGAGTIEQDADVIIMIYRDEYYNPDSTSKGMMELIRTKVREGEPGTTHCQFIGKYQRICDLPHQFNNTGE